ncbi:5'-3' exonuclease [Aneurinibacillus terranovensis]|uniref:5'-3' exonuclease n=1 Tax=Aneurinibacillus terranovensis TaxID=278991 RepID=UPI000687D4A7|nr:5'-3' exonuclease H3TH domain-containing protein [Aneurinibacillus terranovensis]
MGQNTKCSVLFAPKGTVHSTIGTIDSLISQLKRNDLSAAVAQIVLDNNLRLTLQVTSKTSATHYRENPVALQEQDVTWCELPIMSNVKQLIQNLTQLKKLLFTWLLQQPRGRWYEIKRIVFTDGILEIEKLTGSPSKIISLPSIKQERLLLIDGPNVLNMAFYASSTNGEEHLLRNHEGLYTNAVLAMTRKLFHLLRDFQPTHLAICWDVRRSSTFRRQLYEGYKAGRGETPPPLLEQYFTAHTLFQSMNIQQFLIQGYEADDLIGTLATLWKKSSQGECYIVSSDKDLFQLLNFQTSLLRQVKGTQEHFTVQDFTDQFGIDPKQWIDVKAILGETGKSSDNIPGIAGLGEKAAFPLIQQYGNLEGIYNALTALEKVPSFNRYVKKLEQGRDMAFLSKKLATIVTDVPGLPTSIDQLKVKIDKKAMVTEFERLGFKSILNDLREGKYRAS